VWKKWKKLNLMQHKHAFANQKKRNVLQHKINTKKLKPGLVTFNDIWPGNGAGLFLEEKISKEKVNKKRINGEVHNINKQTICV